MPPSPPANPIAILIIIITIIIIIISSVHLAHHHFAERNVLGKPMSRAIQNDIQNIQKMLDKDIEDSSLSGKNYLLSSSPLIPVYLAGNPVTSYLSELCISPSEMRFKFLPTFIEFPSHPSPKPPPLHTLCIWGAHQNSVPRSTSDEASAYIIIINPILSPLAGKHLILSYSVQGIV